MTVLSYKNVEISYDGVAVVHDVSFDVARGEILGIVGESGSGKSTLIKAAMGLLGEAGMVTRGDIFYEGKNLPDISEKELRALCGPKLSFVFQDCRASLSPIRTIWQQICDEMYAHGITDDSKIRENALNMFEKIGLKDGERVLKSYPFELSGGMNQRVGIAMALLLSPEVLFADEPTSALDVSVQKQVIGEMLHARKLFGTTILIVTHNIGVVSYMADHLLVLKDGCVREYGDTQDVINNPQDAYTKELMAAVPHLKK